MNGTKCFATNGGYADLYVIVATVDKSLRSKGTVAFMVEGGAKGLQIGAHEDKMGLRLSNTVTLYLEDLRVPKANMLGVVGDGLRIALHSLDVGRLFNAAVSVGIAQHALEESVAYAKVRRQFGKPIIENQAVQIFGGYGYSKEYPVEKIMRDAKIFQIFEGTNQIQRLVVARELGKRYG